MYSLKTGYSGGQTLSFLQYFHHTWDNRRLELSVVERFEKLLDLLQSQ